MKTLEEIKSTLLFNRPLLKKKYGIKYLALFGSYTRNEQTAKSDIDLLYLANDPFNRFVSITNLEEYLSLILHTKVDLVPKDLLKPNVGKNILKEAIRLI